MESRFGDEMMIKKLLVKVLLNYMEVFMDIGNLVLNSIFDGVFKISGVYLYVV